VGSPALNIGAAPGTGPSSAAPAGGVFNAGPANALANAVPGIPGVPVPFIADFPATTVGPGSGSAIDLALGSIDGSKALDARITALEQEGKAKVISRPKVTTANNQSACIASVLISRVRLPSAGTIIGSGGGAAAVDREVGSACIAERRGIELIDGGAPVTPYMKFGDRVRIEMFDAEGRTIFGAIDQRVMPLVTAK